MKKVLVLRAFPPRREETTTVTRQSFDQVRVLEITLTVNAISIRILTAKSVFHIPPTTTISNSRQKASLVFGPTTATTGTLWNFVFKVISKLFVWDNIFKISPPFLRRSHTLYVGRINCCHCGVAQRRLKNMYL